MPHSYQFAAICRRLPSVNRKRPRVALRYGTAPVSSTFLSTIRRVTMATNQQQTVAFTPSVEARVPEDARRLDILRREGKSTDVPQIAKSLRQDLVVLIEDVAAEEADALIQQVADALGLLDTLTLQAGFAAFLGHRHNVGTYFMSVNNRDSYQFVTPHSEGDRFSKMQLASFYCYENSTDGGETMLFNIDDSGGAWRSFREKGARIKPGGKPLPSRDAARGRMLFRFHP